MENLTYDEFINNILKTRGRFECGDEYHERHHIVPKCLGGADDEDNLIDLLAREHFEAHRLLALETPNNTKLVYAWWMMSHIGRVEINDEEYEEAKILLSQSMQGHSVSEESRQKISDSRKGKYAGEHHPMYGKHFSEESRQKMSKAKKGKHVSEETRRKMSEKNKGKNNPNYGNHKLAGGNHPKAKAIQCVETGIIYTCAIEASQKTGVGAANIRKVKNKTNHTAGGYHWVDAPTI